MTWAALRIAGRFGQVYGTESSRTVNQQTDVGPFLVPVAVAFKCYRLGSLHLIYNSSMIYNVIMLINDKYKINI